MQITNNYSSQNFKALNYTRVNGDGLKLVKKELPQLRKLGKKYDINLSSNHDVLFDTEYINVKVNHLNKKPDFLKNLFSTKGTSSCQVNCESIIDATIKAINSLK